MHNIVLENTSHWRTRLSSKFYFFYNHYHRITRLTPVPTHPARPDQTIEGCCLPAAVNTL